MSVYFGRPIRFGRSVYFPVAEDIEYADRFGTYFMDKSQLGFEAGAACQPYNMYVGAATLAYDNTTHFSGKLDTVFEEPEPEPDLLAPVSKSSDYALGLLNESRYAQSAASKEIVESREQLADIFFGGELHGVKEKSPAAVVADPMSVVSTERPDPRVVRIRVDESVYMAPIPDLKHAFDPRLYSRKSIYKEPGEAKPGNVVVGAQQRAATFQEVPKEEAPVRFDGTATSPAALGELSSCYAFEESDDGRALDVGLRSDANVGSHARGVVARPQHIQPSTYSEEVLRAWTYADCG